METYGPETRRNLKLTNVDEVSDRITGSSPSTASVPKALAQYAKQRGTGAQRNGIIKVMQFKLHGTGECMAREKYEY